MILKAITIELQQYFQRIGHKDFATCELKTLRSIVLAHATSIPFECLDPLAGIAVSIEINAIFDKLVCRRRGGYCFEQNALLATALRQVGFAVDELSARVWYNTPEETTPPRTHVFLAVTVDGTRWLADCGLGGSTPAGLMKLDCIGDKTNWFQPCFKRFLIGRVEMHSSENREAGDRM